MTTVVFFLFINTVNAAVNIQVQANGKKYTAVLASGSVSAKYDIVFIGDGFKDTEQALFNARVIDAVNALRAMPPYNSYMCSFNIWRVNVISAQSGSDHPKDGIFKNTELDCTYGNPAMGQAERCITSTSPAKCYEAAGYAPSYDAVFVLVNDSQWGGCEGQLVCSSIANGFAGIITHELGHKIGNLADEYTCYLCDGTDDNKRYLGVEPVAANLTIETNRSLIKWKDFINNTTSIPTTADNPPGIVGLFEGGGYNAFGIYRAQFTCHMKTTGAPFCAACNHEMSRILNTYCPLRLLIPQDYYSTKLLFWKLPSCCFCPLFQDFRTKIILPGVKSTEFNVEVVDSHEKIVTTGIVLDNQMQLEFNENGAETYFVRIQPKSAGLTGNTIPFHPKVLRDNNAVRLY